MTNKFSSKDFQFGSVALSALAAASLATLLALALNGPDKALCELLRVLLNAPSSTTEITIARQQLSLLFDFSFALVLSTCACLAGRLSPVPRVIVCLQLFAVTLLVLWFLLGSFLIPRPVAFFSAILFGCLFGYRLRLQRLRAAKDEANRMELVLRNRELLENRLQMVKQDEVDRRLLAADLHDQVLNDLKILNQKFQTFRSEPSDDNAGQIDKLIHQAMNGIRDVMDSLSPAVLEHLGFAPALEDCLRRASERSGGFKVRFKNNAESEDFTQFGLIEQTLLYRLVQECGTNICKHAQASTVKLSLDIVENELLIRVADNGKGMAEGVDASASRGLRYMRQRGDLIGATIAWLPGENGKGTLVEIRMPMKSKTT